MALLLSLLLCTIPPQESAAAVAADLDRPGSWEDDQLAEPLSSEGSTLELTLSDFVRLVLVRNLDLKIAKKGTEITRAGIARSLGTFDPELFVSASRTVLSDYSARAGRQLGCSGEHQSGQRLIGSVHFREPSVIGKAPPGPSLDTDVRTRCWIPRLTSTRAELFARPGWT